jgi:hypothetical protein
MARELLVQSLFIRLLKGRADEGRRMNSGGRGGVPSSQALTVPGRTLQCPG